MALLLAGLASAAGCASAERKKDPVLDEVAVRKGEVLTPTAELAAPPFGLPKPKRSPAAAREEEREED